MRKLVTARAMALLVILSLVGCRRPDAESDPNLRASVHAPDGSVLIAVEVATDAPRRAVAVDRDLVIENGTYEPEFGNRIVVAAYDSGHLVALDMLDRGVRLYGPDGTLEWALDPGSIDEGPIRSPIAVTTAGDHVVLIQVDPNLVTFLDRHGEFVRDVPFDSWILGGSGLPDGSVVALWWQQNEQQHLVRIAPGDADPALVPISVLTREARQRRVKELWPNPDFAVSDTQVFVTAAAEYEVVAVDLQGEVLWDLRARDWSPTRIPEHVLQRPTSRTRRAGRAMSANTSDEAAGDWPTVFPAIQKLAVDGHGRLYVFPFVLEGTTDAYPVDVYSPAGELIARATLPFQGWSDAVGDHVYRVEVESGNVLLVRYRITLPTRASPPETLPAQ